MSTSATSVFQSGTAGTLPDVDSGAPLPIGRAGQSHSSHPAPRESEHHSDVLHIKSAADDGVRKAMAKLESELSVTAKTQADTKPKFQMSSDSILLIR